MIKKDKRLKCPEHPKYKAVRKPIKTKKHPLGCDICYAIWLELNY